MSVCISACLKDINVIMPPANLFNEGSSLLLPYAVYLPRGLVSGVQRNRKAYQSEKCKREREKGMNQLSLMAAFHGKDCERCCVLAAGREVCCPY